MSRSTQRGIRNKAIADTCKAVWVSLGLGRKDQRGPKTWAELAPCLEQYRNRVAEAEKDAEELHRSYMELTVAREQDQQDLKKKIFQEFRETDTLYNEMRGIVKALVEVLGTQCSTEVGFRAWAKDFERSSGFGGLHRAVSKILGDERATEDGFKDWWSSLTRICNHIAGTPLDASMTPSDLAEFLAAVKESQEKVEELEDLHGAISELLGTLCATGKGFREWYADVLSKTAKSGAKGNKNDPNVKVAKILAEVIATILREES